MTEKGKKRIKQLILSSMNMRFLSYQIHGSIFLNIFPELIHTPERFLDKQVPTITLQKKKKKGGGGELIWF